MSNSELIDQYEKMLKDILILRSSTQRQIKTCAELRDVRVSQYVPSQAADKPKKETVTIEKPDV